LAVGWVERLSEPPWSSDVTKNDAPHSALRE
jgi:hypothetical protein